MELTALRSCLWTVEALIGSNWNVYGVISPNRSGFRSDVEPDLFTFDEACEALESLKSEMPRTKFRLVSSECPLWAKSVSFAAVLDLAKAI